MKKIFILTAFVFLQLNASAQKEEKKAAEPVVLITTDLGDIKIKLYNETPVHRDNFLKLVTEGKYDNSIFHRVIQQFMIQGGGINGGTADIGGTLPAEIVPQYFHKRGALAAARMGDEANPEKRSSGSQFYIVQGRAFAEADLQRFAQSRNITFTPEQIKAYTTIGGAPHLDMGYTVFGEVIEGMDVVDKIAACEKGTGDKPVKDIKMKMKVVKK